MANLSSDWKPVCGSSDLPIGARRLVEVANVEIALFNVGGSIFAINNRCPHRKGPLIRGYTDEEGGIKCPMHGWRFDLRTGRSNRPSRAQVYETKTERNTVFVAILAS